MSAKKPKCKHAWSTPAFATTFTRGTFIDRYAYVTVTCSACGLAKQRYPTDEECDAEIARLSCPCCGESKRDHPEPDVQVAQVPQACIALLIERIKRLEERLNNAQVSF